MERKYCTHFLCKYTGFITITPTASVVECEQWRSRQVKPGVMEDIFDGDLWKDFQVYEGTPFLPCIWVINLDWFQHSKYSIGAIYLTIMNLPRSECYKPENVILVGIFPGPSEPSDINSFLDPLVKDILGWN